jgi:ABC-type nickel/cobalt efflux system permease component RcnA
MRWRFSAPWPPEIRAADAGPFELEVRLARASTDRFGCQIVTGDFQPPARLLTSSVPTSIELPLPPDDAPAMPDAKLMMVTRARMAVTLGSEAPAAALGSPEGMTGEQHGFEARIRGLFSADMGMGARVLAVLLCLLWGATHALAPGHGKTIASAYLVGARATYTQAALLGLTVTLTHTAAVLILAVAALILKDRFVYPVWLQPLSAVVIMLLGASMLRRALSGWLHGNHEHHHHSHHHHAHAHDRPAHEGEGGVTPRELLATGLSGGMVPCPAAIVLLLLSWQLGLPALGLVCLVAFGLGLAGTLMLVASLAIAGVKRILAWSTKPEDAAGHRHVSALVSAAGGLALILYGLLFLLLAR